MAAALSTRDFIEQVKKRLPPDAVIPSELWVRYQFWVKNQSYGSADRYSGRLDVKHMVQARQLNHQHVDEHHAAADFRYLQEFAVKFRDYANLVCLDDKHSIKVGELGYPMAAVDKGKSIGAGWQGLVLCCC